MPIEKCEDSQFVLKFGHIFSAIFTQDIEIKNLALGSDDIYHLLSKLDSPQARDPPLFNPSILRCVESLVIYHIRVLTLKESQDTIDLSDISAIRPHHFISLRRLTLQHGRGTTSNLTLPMPWNNLTHVAIASWIAYPLWLDVFASLTALQEGKFFIHRDESRWISNDDEYEARLPHLTKLSLVANCDLSTSPISFGSCILPSLRHLELGAECNSGTSLIGSILGFQIRAFDLRGLEDALKNITTLSLRRLSWQLHETHLADILSLAPNVRSLTLGVDANYDSLFVSLSGQAPVLVPLLEDLTIDCGSIQYNSLIWEVVPTKPSSFFHFSADQLINMVIARRNQWAAIGVSQLKKVAIFLEKEFERVLEMVKEGLMQEVKKGLDLTVQLIRGPENWYDPTRVTHWHEGLLMSQNRDSYCSSCLQFDNLVEARLKKK
jgi:hypothetical protein